LVRKTNELQSQLSYLKNNWEVLLFQLLAKSFGLKINASEFQLLVQGISFEVFKKEMSSQISLEALLFGQGNL